MDKFLLWWIDPKDFGHALNVAKLRKRKTTWGITLRQSILTAHLIPATSVESNSGPDILLLSIFPCGIEFQINPVFPSDPVIPLPSILQSVIKPIITVSRSRESRRVHTILHHRIWLYLPSSKPSYITPNTKKFDAKVISSFLITILTSKFPKSRTT